MKNLFVKIVLAAGLAATLPALAQTKLLYLSPNGVSPNGQYALAAYAQKTAKDGYDSEVSVYLTKIGGDSKLSIASDVIFDWAREEVEVQGYGPTIMAWSLDRDGDENLISNYVLVNNVARKGNEPAFLRLVKSQYKKQAFDVANYEKESVAAVLAEGAKLGFKGEKSIIHTMGDTVITSEVPRSVKDIERVALADRDIDLSFETPLYVVFNYDYTLSRDDSEKLGMVTMLGVVKIEKNETGDLVDTKVSFTAQGSIE